MGRKVVFAVCTLNQWALDFDGNLDRILLSIKDAKNQGASYRSGPELEITGYSCEDHFFEGDTLLHSWEVLLKLLINPICRDIMIDVGMPIMHRNLIYNCRVVFLNQQILLIRPKLLMCDTDNYRESRWFCPWRRIAEVDEYYLPRMIQENTGQSTTPFGDGVIATLDTCIGYEMCEELWSPQSTHIPLSIDGVEIIVNSSGSYTELRKANIVSDLIKSATTKAGGCYLYSNLRGGDGGRVYFNGLSCIMLNGQVLTQGTQFSLREVEVLCATVDLEDIRCYRNRVRTRSALSTASQTYRRINASFSLSSSATTNLVETVPRPWQHQSVEKELEFGPACWLWDYLRRSGQGGFFLPLSGGVDSSSTACIVYSMCRLVTEACDDEHVLWAVRRIVCDGEYRPPNAADLCNRLFVTCYMGTQHSSRETRSRAQALAERIGSYHLGVTIDMAVNAVTALFSTITGKVPRFASQGGSVRESLALQNIQARMRMVLSYMMSQLMLWVRGRAGGLLVLGSGNVDEALRGYFTKYDCSSADVNPIGSVSKNDLRLFLRHMRREYDIAVLDEILDATPTAELEPLMDGRLVQTDEHDMGMTYDELGVFGRLRKQYCCGPYSMFCKLLTTWGASLTPEEIAEKVKHFFRCYAINRHKMTVLTPSYHAEYYSPDDNRFDHRPFLYNVTWNWQFRAIDERIQQMKGIANGSLESTRSDHSSMEAKDTKEIKPRIFNKDAFFQKDTGNAIVVSNRGNSFSNTVNSSMLYV